MQLRRGFGQALLWRGAYAVWAFAMLSLCAYLLGGHLLTLPVPAVTNRALEENIAQLRSRPGWMMVHVLYPECTCSQRILEHVLRREPLSGVREHVLLVGREASIEARLRRKSRAYSVIRKRELSTVYGIEAAPILVISDPSDQLRYVGGYTERKQGPQIQDSKVLAELKAEKRLEPLPLFGCAVGEALSAAIDPLDIR